MPDMEAMLDESRRELLDLTGRNRLLNTPRSMTRSSRVEIVDEKADQVFERLAIDGQTMTFLGADQAGASPLAADWDVGADNKNDSEENAPASRYTDSRLQTTLESEMLEKRLLKLQYEARTCAEEQGVNVLYLAMGFLVWFEEERSEVERHAPLVLLPVELQRTKAGSQFTLSYSGDELATNLSLQERLRSDFGIELPELPEAIEDLRPTEYCQQVREAIEGRGPWRLQQDDLVLWHFVFSKIRMFTDLKSDAWPEGKRLKDNRLVRSLLGEGFKEEAPLFPDNGEPIDARLPVAETVHVVDADSSQAMVIEEARRGRDLVVQGPPGTGKSQTIANIIAASVQEGKTVLFMAEKMAALEVVYRRLKQIDLGDLCLELHSNKANRKALLGELDRTLKLGEPRLKAEEHLAQALQQRVDMLNTHAVAMASCAVSNGYTPHQIIGEITRLRSQGVLGRQLTLEGCDQWERSVVEENLTLAANLESYASAVGRIGENPWRGVELEVVLPMDIDRSVATMRSIVGRLERLSTSGEELAGLIGASKPENGRRLSVLARFVKKLAELKTARQRLLGDPLWLEDPQAIDDLITNGARLTQHRIELSDWLDPHSIEMDVKPARMALKAYGTKWHRWFARSYREALVTLRSISTGDVPAGHEERVKRVTSLIELQESLRKFNEDKVASLGAAAFGDEWRGEDSDWDELEKFRDAAQDCLELGKGISLTEMAQHTVDSVRVQGLLKPIRKNLQKCFEEIKTLGRDLCFQLPKRFGLTDSTRMPLEGLRKLLDDCLREPEGLKRWVDFRSRCQELESRGLQDVVQHLVEGKLKAGEVGEAVELAYFEAIMRVAYENHPHLASFNGASHERVRESFCQFDVARMLHCRAIVARTHWRGVPRSGAYGEVGVILKEVNKKRRHLPIRVLMGKAGRVVQKIKPVFMMSPMSVAQFLPPGKMEFDLLLIDEASQVQPVDAFGAMARAKQVVVVGDSKQLPPTSFFSRSSDDEGEEPDDDSVGVKNLESILGMCCALGATQRMLRWHYRSRHHSLIEFSNHEFYDDQLYVVPSPAEPRAGMGLEFRHLPEASYDRGKSRTNRAEAAEVARAVMQHAARFPEVTLGVGAFSVAQRDAILDEVERLRRKQPEHESFFSVGDDEPFFVKNLENIQGDERDVIFISVGYGKDADGHLTMSFGPLNKEGGERRLNVLVTRARSQCVVFSSLEASDIDLNWSKARGVVAFKAFLQYAKTGLLDTETAPGAQEHDSEFERQVAKALRAVGVETYAQVGVAGFRIDLCVIDPDQPGRYLLGIECDGATYHSSRSARDRDRIRQSVLEARGWKIHRIWSTDWFNFPEEELRKVVVAVEEAKASMEASAREPAPPVEQAQTTNHQVVRDESTVVEERGGVTLSVPYEVASFDVDRTLDIPDAPLGMLANVATKVVEIEGPIHEEEVARRIAQLWGSGRAGSRIRKAVQDALKRGIKANKLMRLGEYMMRYGERVRVVRDRSETGLATLKKPELIATQEIELALSMLVRDHVGISREEVVKATATEFGIRTLHAALREHIEGVLEGLLARRLLLREDERLSEGRRV